MPAPRAVLNDIHDLKLDPKKIHKSTTKAGRLLSDSKNEPVKKSGLVFIEKTEENTVVASEEKSLENSDVVEPTENVDVPQESSLQEEVQEKTKTVVQNLSEKSKKKQQYQKKNSYNN